MTRMGWGGAGGGGVPLFRRVCVCPSLAPSMRSTRVLLPAPTCLLLPACLLLPVPPQELMRVNPAAYLQDAAEEAEAEYRCV